MLLTGQEYLESIRDGRRVYVGSERVDDVTTHPAFRNAARSFAMIYDRKRAPENRAVMTFEEGGETFSSYFLLPRTREDLQKRFETHRRIASWTYGLLGRSPDNFPSYVSGLVMDPAMFDRIRPGFGDNIRSYYKHMRSNDIFASHTVTNPQGWRMADPNNADKRTPPTLRVVAEDDAGVTINGLKMLGTATAFCHETWCGNLQPVAPGAEKESITCVVPLNAPGVSIWSRKPYEKYAVSEFDNPLASRFDENDAAVLFQNVKVPWERVFCHDNVEMTRAIYMRTPAHAMANHQANVRFLEKLKLIIGIAGKVADMNGARSVPAVQFTLGRLAAMEATLEGLIMGQLNTGERHPNGYRTVNRRYVYAALHWCSTHYAEICDTVRELMGAGVFQMPADASVLKDEKLRETFETYWSVPGQPAADRMKLLNLAWDLLGSDFAGRHMQYEKFYAGPGFVMNSYSYGTGLGKNGKAGWTNCWRAPKRRTSCRKSKQPRRDEMTPTGVRAGTGQGSGPMSCFCDCRAEEEGIQTQPRLHWGARRVAQGRFEMRKSHNMLLATVGVAFGGLMAALLAPAPAAFAQDKTFTMKLSTATINDTQHEWLKRFAAQVEKDSGGKIKAEIYPASQLGSIPRQIEGTQFGSIQGWMGPPEFLVGVDERFEAPSAPGLFSSVDQVMKVFQEPAVKKMIFDFGTAKGLVGVGFAPIGPSSILTKKQVTKIADLSGMKIRVLASQFQLELIRRMGGSPIAMTLADVLPGLQQGTIDGTLTTMTIYTTMRYYDAGKFVINTDQPYVNSIGVMSKKWMDTLPADLQKVVNDAGAKVTAEITPYVKEFFAEQVKIFTTTGGGTISNLPKAEHDAMIAKVSTIGDDLSKSKPALNTAVKTLFESAARNK